MTTRLRITVAYAGGNFHGWAAQPGLRTVEGELSEALSLIFQSPCQLIVAGRTDAGVHAAAQTVHVDVDNERPLALDGQSLPAAQPQLVRRLNKILAARGVADIVALAVEITFPQFNARFCALSRTYCYRIGDSPATWFPTRSDIWRWNSGQGLDVYAMDAAAQAFVGEHDFLGYAKPREGASTVREIFAFRAERDLSSGLIVCTVRGDAFCHSQVRFMVGALVDVGRGAKNAQWLAERLDDARQVSGARLAPPEGLTLEEVEYPESPEDMERQRIAAQRYRG